SLTRARRRHHRQRPAPLSVPSACQPGEVALPLVRAGEYNTPKPSGGAAAPTPFSREEEAVFLTGRLAQSPATGAGSGGLPVLPRGGARAGRAVRDDPVRCRLRSCAARAGAPPYYPTAAPCLLWCPAASLLCRAYRTQVAADRLPYGVLWRAVVLRARNGG